MEGSINTNDDNDEDIAKYRNTMKKRSLKSETLEKPSKIKAFTEVLFSIVFSLISFVHAVDLEEKEGGINEKKYGNGIICIFQMILKMLGNYNSQ